MPYHEIRNAIPFWSSLIDELCLSKQESLIRKIGFVGNRSILSVRAK